MKLGAERGSRERREGRTSPSSSLFLEMNEGILLAQAGNGVGVKWGVGIHRPRRSTSPHLHENGEPGCFSCSVSFSDNETNCCSEELSVSLETNWLGGEEGSLRVRQS